MGIFGAIIEFLLVVEIPDIAESFGPNADISVIKSADGRALPFCIWFIEQRYQ
jgi:hypothetical protein